MTAGTLWLWASSRSRGWPGVVVLGIVVGELFALGVGFNSSFPASMTFPSESSLVALAELTRSEAQPVRVVNVPTGGRLITSVGLSPDCWSHSDGMTFQVNAVRGKRQPATIRFLEHLPPPSGLEDRAFVPVEVDLSDLAGHVVLLALMTGPGPAHDLSCDRGAWVEPVVTGSGEPTLELLHDGPNRIYRNRSALLRAWLVRRAIEVKPGNLDLAGRRLVSPTFEPAVEAVVEGRVGLHLGARHAGDGARVLSYEPERVELEVDTAEPALLVMSDMFYPGWRATVDGPERAILPTNMSMRSVVVDGGNHLVVFEYLPKGLRKGLWIALATLLAVGVALVVGARRAVRRCLWTG